MILVILPIPSRSKSRLRVRGRFGARGLSPAGMDLSVETGTGCGARLASAVSRVVKERNQVSTLIAA